MSSKRQLVLRLRGRTMRSPHLTGTRSTSGPIVLRELFLHSEAELTNYCNKTSRSCSISIPGDRRRQAQETGLDIDRSSRKRRPADHLPWPPGFGWQPYVRHTIMVNSSYTDTV